MLSLLLLQDVANKGQIEGIRWCTEDHRMNENEVWTKKYYHRWGVLEFLQGE